jgi:hypothetical protein
MSRSGADRLRLASSMCETAQKLLISKNSNLTDKLGTQEVLLEGFYGNDLSDHQKRQILSKIKANQSLDD